MTTLDIKDLYVNLPIQNVINIKKFWLNKKKQNHHNNIILKPHKSDFQSKLFSI